MIAKLTGRVDGTGADWVVIDVNGVGYQVFVSARTLAAVAGEAGPVSLLIDTHVREDHFHLYGFAGEEERAMYRLLTTVQGVGAKVGLGILSVLSSAQIAQAVAAGDKAMVTQAPGVGPKLAARIVSELKDKVGGIALAGEIVAAVPTDAAGPSEAGDAVSALVNLGYSRSEAYGAVARAQKKLGEDAGVEALIRDGLSQLASAEAHA